MTTAKSIVDVQVNDESFKAFVELFNEYRARLADLPQAWNKVGVATEVAGAASDGLAKASEAAAESAADIVTHFTEVTAALMAQAELHRRIEAQERAADSRRQHERDAEKKADKEREAAQKRYQSSVEKTNKQFKDMRANIGGAVTGIASAATDVLKWVGLGGVASGLLGAGGLFGLDRLAASAGESRRSAQGLDTSIGDLKAFSVNYARVVEPGAFLSNIETVARTPGLQYGVGGNIAQMAARGMDTADIGAALVPLIKQTFQQYGANAYGLKASGLDNVVSLQEAIRISKLSDDEIAEIGGKYDKGKSSLAVNDQVAKDWQDLSVQLNNAGERIENVLIKDLDKLAPVINHLSDEAVDLVDKFVTRAVPSIDRFASYLDSDEFQKNLRDGAKVVKDFADGALEAARVLGLIDRPAPDRLISSNAELSQYNLRHPDQAIPLDPTKSAWDQSRPGEISINDHLPFDPLVPDSYMHHLPGTAPWENKVHVLGATRAPGRPEDWRALHNPGDLFVPGSKTEMLGFADDAAGIRGTEKQLMIYQTRDRIDTIEGLAEKYAPREDPRNNTDAYIKNMVARTGFAKDQHLNFGDTDVASRLVSAITKQEHSNTNYTPQAVRLVIENNTGGSAVVSASQLGAS